MIIAVNKPKGITSHDAVDIIKRKLEVKKAGHTGTLDPMAEGVLIILTDEDTKKQSAFMGMEKEYVAGIKLGVKSDTYDITGIVSKNRDDCPIPNKEDIRKLLKSFVGNIAQEVPPYSAVKIKGKPLYKYAREGKIKNVTLPVKKVFIKNIKILDYKYPYLNIKVVCSKGTYIRSLANDIGKALGCGGILTSLTRTRIGEYTLDACSDLGTISIAHHTYV